MFKNFLNKFYAQFTALTGKTGTETENRRPKLTETENRVFPLTGTENRVSKTGQNRKPGVPVNNRVCPTLIHILVMVNLSAGKTKQKCTISLAKFPQKRILLFFIIVIAL